jgi:hypothetical protein
MIELPSFFFSCQYRIHYTETMIRVYVFFFFEKDMIRTKIIWNEENSNVNIIIMNY